MLGSELEGCLVDFRQPAAAAAAIARLLDDPTERDRLAAVGRDRSRAFDIDRLWSDLQALYPSPVAGR